MPDGATRHTVPSRRYKSAAAVRLSRWFRFKLQYWLPNAVNSSGAVSPATRANASMQPVIIPGMAVRRLTDIAVRHFGTPSPKAASRIACGTVASISSVVRVIVGIIMIASATPARERRKMLLRFHDQRIDRDAHHNRRHSVQHIRGKPHCGRQRPCPGRTPQDKHPPQCLSGCP